MNANIENYEKWLEWAKQPNERREGRTNILPEIVQYLKAHPEDFQELAKGMEDCSWIAAPNVDSRTWETVSETLIDSNLDNTFGTKYQTLAEIPKEDLVRQIAGIIGPDAAKRFADFIVRSHSVYHVERKEKPILPTIKLTITTKTNIITQEDVEANNLNQNALYEIIISDGVTAIEKDAFSGCKITEIEIPTSVTKIGAGAFDDNYLSAFRCPQGICEIESGTYTANDIEEIIIPKHIRKVGDWAFCGNPIKRIVIDNPDCEIGDGAFFVGAGLKEIHLVGFETPPQHIQQWFWGDTDADRNPKYLKECRLFVPKGTARLYKEYNEDYPILNVRLMDTLEEQTGACSPNPYLFFKEIVEE